jgi:hypothetical protein
MAVTYNRAGVTRRLAYIAAAVLPEVTVTYGWPGENVATSCMWFGAPEGLSEPESLGFGKKLAQDRFAIPVALSRAGFLTAEEAAEGVEEWLRLFDQTLRPLHCLKDPSGAIPDGPSGEYQGVRSAVIGQVTGPGWNLPHPTQDSDVVGGIAFTIDCVTQLS